MNKIRELRKQEKLSQSELATKFNTTVSNISGWELGKWQPDNETLLKLADFFGVSVDYLLGRDDFTPEERAAGAMATRKESITPLEDDLLYTFRQIGKRFGEQAQRDFVTVGENMLKLK